MLIFLQMVRTYHRKTARANWDLKQMELAAVSVRNGELSLRAASAAFGVPKSTLERHKNKRLLSPGCLGRFRPVLDTHFETELADYCKEMQNRLFGLTISDLRKMAYQLAEKNNVEHNFDVEREMAGRDWVFGALVVTHAMLRRLTSWRCIIIIIIIRFLGSTP